MESKEELKKLVLHSESELSDGELLHILGGNFALCVNSGGRGTCDCSCEPGCSSGCKGCNK